MAIATQTGSGWNVPDPARLDFLPGGGTVGQVLTKRTAVDADADWEDGGVIGAIVDGSIGSVKLAPLSTSTVLGRISGGTGPVEAVPMASLPVSTAQAAADAGVAAAAAAALSGGLAGKQPTLVGTAGVGQNLKTLNGGTLLGTGDIAITAGGVVVNDLTTGGTTSALSAEQGVTLKGLTDANATALAGKGDASGPSASTDGEVALFNSTTGKLLKRSNGLTGYLQLAAGVASAVSAAALKTALALVKGDVGLGNVDNTSDATKNSASATLTNKTVTAPVLSGAVTGTATLPATVTMAATPSQGDNSAKIAPTSYVDAGLAGKVDLLAGATLGSGTTAITRATHLNRPNISNQAGATTWTFAATATSGALPGDGFECLNTGAGTATASGAIAAAAGYKLTCLPGEVFSAVYDSIDDAFKSATPSASAGSVATDPIWDVAGDLAYGTGADTAARLPPGTALQQLRMNAGATAPEWATVSGAAAALLTMAQSSFGLWVPNMTGSSTAQAFGIGLPTVLDSSTAGSGASTSDPSGTFRRIRYTAAAAAANRVAGIAWATSNGLPLRFDSGGSYNGGFPVLIMGGPADATAAASFWLGLTGSTTPSFTATEPSAYGANDMIGFGWDSTAGTNFANGFIFRNDNAGAVQVTDLGGTFDKTQGQLYAVLIDKDAAGTSIYVTVYKAVNGGTWVASSTQTYTTDIPRGTVAMAPSMARSSMASAVAVTLDAGGVWRGKQA